MSFEKLTADVANISRLDDEPNDVGGLTSTELKAAFDAAGLTLKAFVNGLIDALAAETAAEHIGAAVEGLPGHTLAAVLAGLKSALDGLPKQAVTGLDYDGESQSLVLTLADGSERRVSLQALLPANAFADSDSIGFSVSGMAVTASVKAGGVTLAMLSGAVREALETGAASAAGSAAAAEAARAAIENMGVAAETLAAGSAATVTKTVENGAVKLTYGLPRGEPGPPGAAGASCIDQNSGRLVRFWFGTLAEYNALGTYETDVYYNILEGEV